MENNEKKSIQNKLTSVKYNCANKTHLVINQEICANCKEKTCTFICPANVYTKNENIDEIVVQYENCLECGACRIACPKKNIQWEYPSSGSGVIYKNS